MWIGGGWGFHKGLIRCPAGLENGRSGGGLYVDGSLVVLGSDWTRGYSEGGGRRMGYERILTSAD